MNWLCIHLSKQQKKSNKKQGWKEWIILKHFLSIWRTSRIINDKITEPCCMDSSFPQDSPISPFLFPIYTNSLHKIKECGFYTASFIDDITIKMVSFWSPYLLCISLCFIFFSIISSKANKLIIYLKMIWILVIPRQLLAKCYRSAMNRPNSVILSLTMPIS